MSESQFEKLLNTLKTAERERDLARHTVEVQDGIINELREENDRLREEVKRLRGLLRKSRPWLYRGECDFDKSMNSSFDLRDNLLNEIEKELGYQR